MKKLMLFSMWLAASAAAVGVAWAGVSVVDNQVVDPPSVTELASPTASDDNVSGQAVAPGSQPTPTPAEEPRSSPTSSPVEELTAGGQTPSSTSATPATDPPSDTSPTSRATPQPATVPTSQPAPTTVPSTQPTATAPTSTSTPAPTAPPPPTATTQTFTLTGGTAAVSFSASGVEVLWATPNPGFDVSIEPESPGIKVEFRADHHRSRVDAWWSVGPQHAIREEPQN